MQLTAKLQLNDREFVMPIASCSRLIPILYEDAPKYKMGAFGVSVMGMRLLIEIKESQEELEKALKYVTQASSKERLQMLYWLKSGQVTSRQAIAERLGRDPSNHNSLDKKVQRWGTTRLTVDEICAR
ncbi:hypothetical protein NSTCB13_06577 [Nostoc sp. DSM 114160]